MFLPSSECWPFWLTTIAVFYSLYVYFHIYICPDTYLPEWILDEVRTFCTCVQLVDVYFRRLEWTRYNGRLVGVQHHNSTMVHCASAFPADHAYVVRTAVFLFAVSRERSVCCVLLKDFFFIQLWKFAYYYALSTFSFDPWWSMVLGSFGHGTTQGTSRRYTVPGRGVVPSSRYRHSSALYAYCFHLNFENFLTCL